MKIFTLLFFCFTLLANYTFAQERSCASMEVLDQIIQQNPEVLQQMDAIERHTENFIKEGNLERNGNITIPVVVHVVWKTNTQNISDAQIQSQIDILNEDFLRLNSDANNYWSQGANTNIEFCLASVDPSGNPTNGIQRRKTNKPSFSSNDNMKFNNKGGLNAWPASDYLNIWVCNLQSFLGYAQFPGGPANTDGVVVGYQYFGNIGTASAPFDLGRTTTHEVGHWLNLRHIWGDGGCSVDDFVSDTPLSDAPNYGCASGHVSCGSEDMVQNYMDYSDDGCMNLFTAGQSARMNAVLAPGGARASLANSTACGGGSSGPTCTDGVQNGDETGVDCGGSSCAPCSTPPTCTDGIQNGDETGVDCGGSSCAPCSTGGTCDDPSNLSYTSKKGGKEALLTWNAVSGANDYTVQIREVGTSWTTATASGTSITFTGITKNKDYEWQVLANCSSGSSNYTYATFTAGTSNRLSNDIAEFRVYPNPSTENITIEYQEFIEGEVVSLSVVENPTDAVFTIFVMDLRGQVLFTKTTTDISTTFDVSNIASGMYFIQIMQDNQLINSQKFIKQ